MNYHTDHLDLDTRSLQQSVGWSRNSLKNLNGCAVADSGQILEIVKWGSWCSQDKNGISQNWYIMQINQLCKLDIIFQNQS